MLVTEFKSFKDDRTTQRSLQIAKKKTSVTGYNVQSLKLTFTFFEPRVLTTAGTWYCNDISFDGNKLFHSEIISVITNSSKSLMPGWLYNLINICVALVGNYLASKSYSQMGVLSSTDCDTGFLIDNKLYGRKHMMTVGFLHGFHPLQCPWLPLQILQLINPHPCLSGHVLSVFVLQSVRPNSVTFLVATEVYPTAVRAAAHGFLAACGKLGALTAAVLYNYNGTQTKFYVVPWFGLAGVLLTVLFLPDTIGLDFKEI